LKNRLRPKPKRKKSRISGGANAEERLMLVEPELSVEHEVRFQHGMDMFNTGHNWEILSRGIISQRNFTVPH